MEIDNNHTVEYDPSPVIESHCLCGHEWCTKLISEPSSKVSYKELPKNKKKATFLIKDFVYATIEHKNRVDAVLHSIENNTFDQARTNIWFARHHWDENNKLDGEIRDEFIGLAKVAIAAMREPTIEMLISGALFKPGVNTYNQSKDDAKISWQFMIDAALKED